MYFTIFFLLHTLYDSNSQFVYRTKTMNGSEHQIMTSSYLEMNPVILQLSSGLHLDSAPFPWSLAAHYHWHCHIVKSCHCKTFTYLYRYI